MLQKIRGRCLFLQEDVPTVCLVHVSIPSHLPFYLTLLFIISYFILLYIASDDASGAEPSSPENINQIVQLQYDEMNTRLAYLREQIGNLAAKHYGPNAHRKLQRYFPTHLFPPSFSPPLIPFINVHLQQTINEKKEAAALQLPRTRACGVHMEETHEVLLAALLRLPYLQSNRASCKLPKLCVKSAATIGQWWKHVEEQVTHAHLSCHATRRRSKWEQSK